jgi:hypothetical protein
MTLREIDERLVMWTSTLRTVAQNLMDLQSQPTYQRLAGLNGMPRAELSGISATKIAPALEAMGMLFQYFNLLQSTIEQAEELRRRIVPFLSNDQKLHDIELLLAGKSIHLPTAQVPLQQRALLTGAEDVDHISPGDLLKQMSKAFEASRDAVLTVDAAWEKLGTGMSEAVSQIGSLKNLLEKLGSPPSFELQAANHQLEQLRAAVVKDPLGALDTFERQVQPLLASVRKGIEERAQLQKNIGDLFSASQLALHKLEQLHREAALSFAERQDKVAGCGSPEAIQSEDKIQRLRDWLVRLEKKRDEGMVQPLSVGLRNWYAAAQECTEAEQKAHDVNSKPLEARKELRGRMDALKAKARAYGLAEEPGLLELASETDKVLYARPTPMDRAARMVAEYEKKLSLRSAHARA